MATTITHVSRPALFLRGHAQGDAPEAIRAALTLLTMRGHGGPDGTTFPLAIAGPGSRPADAHLFAAAEVAVDADRAALAAVVDAVELVEELAAAEAAAAAASVAPAVAPAVVAPAVVAAADPVVAAAPAARARVAPTRCNPPRKRKAPAKMRACEADPYGTSAKRSRCL